MSTQIKKVNLYTVANQFYFGIGYNTLKQAKMEMHRLNKIKNKFCYHIDKNKYSINY